MKRIKENITGNLLKHMTHAEDLILLNEKGCNLIYNNFKDIYKILNNENVKNIKITKKFDGSPAVIVASDFYGKKFVALKHSWDKGKVFESIEDIKLEYIDKPDLASKLILVFSNIENFNIPKNEIWMGDFLFSNSDLKEVIINDISYLTFKPNTLTYAIPTETELANKIRNSRLGTVWHTKYTKELDNIKMSFDIKINNSCSNIYQISAELPKTNTKNTSSLKEIKPLLKSLKVELKSLLKNTRYKNIIENKTINTLLLRYENYLIKKDIPCQSPKFEDFLNWVTSIYNKEKEEKKTEKGKNSVEERKQATIDFIIYREDVIEQLWEVQQYIIAIKEIYEKEFNSISPISVFIEEQNNYIPTTDEGYVISDNYCNVYKIINRLNFSRYNFRKETD